MKVLVGLALAVLVVSASWSVIASLALDEPRPSVLPVPVTTGPVATTRAPSGASTSTSAVAPGASTTVPASVPSTTAPSVARFTTAQIATHSSSSSCWLVVNGRVYDVTTYLRSHPGGSRTITPWCGKESTVAFATEDGRGEHSTDAYVQLERYLIGELAP